MARKWPPPWYPISKGKVLLNPPPKGFGSYTPGKPGFLDLVNATQGNAGSASDGFDAAMSLLMAADTLFAAANDGVNVTLSVLDTVMADFDAITDELGPLIDVGTALADADEGNLGEALLAAIPIPNPPTLLPIPTVPTIALALTSLNNAGTGIGNSLLSLVSGIACQSYFGGGGGCGMPSAPPADASSSSPSYSPPYIWIPPVQATSGANAYAAGSLAVGGVVGVIVPIVDAFLVFNSIVSFLDASYNFELEQLGAWCKADPLDCGKLSLQEQINTLTQQLNQGTIPQGERDMVEANLAKLQKALDVLNQMAYVGG